MKPSRRRLCLVYLGPTICLIGVAYTIFYTEYKLPKLIRQKQQQKDLMNKNLYSYGIFANTPNQTNKKKIQLSPFAINELSEDKKILANSVVVTDSRADEDNESGSEEDTNTSLEECQVWMPIKDKDLLESSTSKHGISDKKFLSVCSIESALKSARLDDDTKRKVCLVLDRFDKNLLLSLYNQSHHVMQDFDKDTINNLQTAEWYKALQKRYNVGGSKLKLIMPDYATVFSGTIYYRTINYINKYKYKD